MKWIQKSLRCLPAIVIVLASGCFGGAGIYPVRGTVTFEGKPMQGGGAIAFYPMGDQKGKTAGGEIKSDGTYELATHGLADGSMVGQFRVVITQVTEKEPEATPDGKAPPKSDLSMPKSERIPKIYADPQKSPLIATVESKSNEIDFELKRK